MRYRRQRLQTSQNKEGECSGNNCVLLAACLIVVTIIVLYFAFGPNIYHQQPIVIGQETIVSLTAEKQQIVVHEKTIKIKGDDIYYRYAVPRGSGIYTKPDVLLLHGSKYASSTWRGLGTLQIFAYYGYRTFAIDLPGYKLSTRAKQPETEVEIIAWMDELILSLELKKLVLVVPSMSGKYGLPFLFSNEPDLVGMVAISPTYTGRYTKTEYEAVNIPVLILFGERDNTEEKKLSEHNLGYIPQHSLVMIKHAEHVAFVGNPKDFHTEILRFLTSSISIGNEESVFDDIDDGVGNYNNDNADYFLQDYEQLNGLFTDEKDDDTFVGDEDGGFDDEDAGIDDGKRESVDDDMVVDERIVVVDESVEGRGARDEYDGDGRVRYVEDVKKDDDVDDGYLHKHRYAEEDDERDDRHKLHMHRYVDDDERDSGYHHKHRYDDDERDEGRDDMGGRKKYTKFGNYLVNDEPLQKKHGLADDDE